MIGDVLSDYGSKIWLPLRTETEALLCYERDGVYRYKHREIYTEAESRRVKSNTELEDMSIIINNTHGWIGVSARQSFHSSSGTTRHLRSSFSVRVSVVSLYYQWWCKDNSSRPSPSHRRFWAPLLLPNWAVCCRRERGWLHYRERKRNHVTVLGEIPHSCWTLRFYATYLR